MRIVSLYSGGGGMDEGLRQAGFKTALAVETDPAACATLKQNHPGTEVLQSTVQDAQSTIGRADMVIGGPPCQAFSRATPAPTYDGTEVRRFFEVTQDAGARHWIMENVAQVAKVLKRPDGHNIDVANYGVPQHRVRRIYSDLPVPRRTHGPRKQVALDGRIVEPWVSTGAALGLETGTLVCKRQYEPRPYPLSQPSVTVLTSPRLWYKADREARYAGRPCKDPGKHPSHHIDAPAHCIVTKDYGHGSNFITDGELERKLSTAECAALQGFPPTYVFCGTKTEQQRQVGNALPPPVARAYAAQIALEVPAV